MASSYDISEYEIDGDPFTFFKDIFGRNVLWEVVSTGELHLYDTTAAEDTKLKNHFKNNMSKKVKLPKVDV